MLSTPSAPTTNGLWKHQQEAVNRLLPLPVGGLFIGLGGGKTRVALEIARRRRLTRILVLCPSSQGVLPRQWERQAQQWLPDLSALNLGSGPVANRIARLHATECGLAVVNYDVVPAMAQALQRWAPEMVIMDEIQRVKAHNGVQSKAVAAIKAPYRLGLSGTPISHSPLDAFGVYRALDSRIFGTSWTMFKRRYTVPCKFGEHQGMEIGRGGALTPYRFVGLNELHTKVMSIAYQVETRAVLDLPPEMDVVRECTLEPEAMRFYRRLDRDLTAEVQQGARVTAPIILTKLLRLMQSTGGWVHDDDGILRQVSAAKERALTDWLDELPPEEPCVVFSRFTPDVQSVHRAAAALGRGSAELSGQRNDLDVWLRGEVPALSVQIQAGGAGIDGLQRACYGCFYSIGHSLTQYLQARGRLVRPGQTRPVHFTHLVAASTVDQEVYGALERREDLIESLMRARS